MPRPSGIGRCCRCTGTARPASFPVPAPDGSLWLVARAETGMQRVGDRRQEVPAADQVDAVVGVAAVGGAASSGDQPCLAQLGQVVRDEVLGSADQLGELAHPPVAASQLGEDLPPVPVGDELEELGGGQLVGGRAHSDQITSIRTDVSSRDRRRSASAFLSARCLGQDSKRWTRPTGPSRCPNDLARAPWRSAPPWSC